MERKKEFNFKGDVMNKYQEVIDGLDELSYKVTQEDATEEPFYNEYDNHFEEGIYVDKVSGKVLFSSTDKFDSGCGWPAFTKEVNHEEIKLIEDKRFGMDRVEVRSVDANSHLGHVFNDGPIEKGGLRYCINSASLRFIKKEDMEKEGYGKFLYFFN